MSTYLHLESWDHAATKKSLTQRLHPKQFARNLRLAWQKSPLYPLGLSTDGKTDLHLIPTDSWPGSLREGRQILDGKFIFGSEIAMRQHLWYPEHLSAAGLADLHSFEWLRNLRTLGDNTARRVARQLILSWISANQNWRSVSWRVDILGHRLSNWIGLYDFFCASADDAFRQHFFKSLYRQTRHLSRCWQDIANPLQQLYALHGLMNALICLNHDTHLLPGLCFQLERLIQKQILDDGGHQSRSPSIQLMVLRILIDLRSLLKQNNQVVPLLLHKTIIKMAPLVRLFRHGDGSLACFGPYHRINPSLIDMVLSMADVRGRPPLSAPSMGYERCTSKTGLILMNLRPATLRTPNQHLENGTGIFNFEWSSTGRRLITYSDVVLQAEEGYFACATENKHGHGHFSFNHQTYSEGSLLETEYQNHEPTWNFSQNRRLFLDNRSFDFRGEEILTSHLSAFYAIRFVFHPNLQLRHHGRNIIIDSPDGQQFLCLSNTKEMHIETLDSSYPAQMLVLLGELQPNQPKKIRWAFKGE